jgi:hypothetical protein
MREPAHERLAYFRRIGAGLRREEQRLADRFDRQRDDDLVRNLRRLPVTVSADERDVFAHLLEERLDLGKSALRSADHDRQRRRFRSYLAAGDGGVEVVAAELVDARREMFRFDRRDRAHVDDDLPRLESLGDAVFPEEHAFDVRRIRDHQEDDLGLPRDLFAVAADRRAAAGQIAGDRSDRMDEQLVPGRFEMSRHRRTHDAEPDETNFTHDDAFLFTLDQRATANPRTKFIRSIQAKLASVRPDGLYSRPTQPS